MTNEVFVSLKDAQQLYGIENTTFERPVYTDKGICKWCGRNIEKSLDFCNKKCEKDYKFTIKWATRNTNIYRDNILRRDNYTCQNCGAPHMMINEHGIKIPVSDGMLQVHHIIPRAKGGSDNPKNLITWCKECHDAYHIKHKDGFGPKY